MLFWLRSEDGKYLIFSCHLCSSIVRFLLIDNHFPPGASAKYLIGNEIFRVGRKEGEIVIADDLSISRKHAVFTVTVSILNHVKWFIIVLVYAF